MAIREWINPWREDSLERGPITRSMKSLYQMPPEQVRLYKGMALIPKPKLNYQIGRDKDISSDSTSPTLSGKK